MDPQYTQKYNKEMIKTYENRLRAYHRDPNKSMRMTHPLCRYCYYWSTEEGGSRHCISCGRALLGFKGVYCHECATEKASCKRCGSLLD